METAPRQSDTPDWHSKAAKITDEFRVECLVYVMPALATGVTGMDVMYPVPLELDRKLDQYRRVPKYAPEATKALPSHLALD